MTPALVSLTDVRKDYGRVQALKGITLTSEPGEVIALLGPNGAGKTTAISVMLGLRKPSSGRATLFGLEPDDRRARSRTGVMLQESGVPGTLQVRELVDLFRSYYPKPLAASRAIELAGLEAKARAQVDSLSGGQKQRLYLALAVCGDPDLLFFDEPTVGLDVEGRRGFVQAIEDFARRGKTVVMTTHYLEEADELASRVVVIDQGVIIAEGTPTEIKSRVPGKLITFRGEVEDAMLAGLTDRIDRRDGIVRIFTNTPEAVLEAMFAGRVRMQDLLVTGAALEDAFVALTKRE